MDICLMLALLHAVMSSKLCTVIHHFPVCKTCFFTKKALKIAVHFTYKADTLEKKYTCVYFLFCLLYKLEFKFGLPYTKFRKCFWKKGIFFFETSMHLFQSRLMT